MSKGNLAIHMLVAVIIAYVLTGILILAAGFVSFKLDLSDRAIGFMVVFIYIFVNAVAGLYIGHRCEKRRFFFGMLEGLLYGAILLVVSVAFSGGTANIAVDGLCSLLLCAGGGTLGGMIS